MDTRTMDKNSKSTQPDVMDRLKIKTYLEIIREIDVLCGIMEMQLKKAEEDKDLYEILAKKWEGVLEGYLDVRRIIKNKMDKLLEN